jgi:(S)-sulfolactate dehydrogenase
MADIVIAEFMDEGVARELAETHDVLYDKDLVDRPADLLAAARDCRALIVRNRTRVDAALLDECPRLCVIGRLGVGLERIDLEACEARGIPVFPARGANSVAVAEYVIAGLLVLYRRAFLASHRVIAGAWPRLEMSGRDLAGKRLGLVGFGDIGRQVAKRARALDMSLMAHDPYVPAEDPAWRDLDTERSGLDRLLSGSDAISLHVPLTEETRHLIDQAAFARMKPDAVLINTTRGGVVDEAALIAALEAGGLGGAIVDVFEEEPLSAAAGAKFAEVPNLILTPHVAGVTEESNHRLSTLTVENVLRVLNQNQREEP